MTCNDKNSKIKNFDFMFRLYTCWRGMSFRCYQKSHRHNSTYIKNKIKVCKIWREDYHNFMEWALKNGYNQNLCLDRINNLKGYNAKNCRWVTYKQNNNNRSDAIRITAWGETKNLSGWLEDKRCKVKSRAKVRNRVMRGINPEKAMTDYELRGWHRNNVKLKDDEVREIKILQKNTSLSNPEIAKRFNVCPETIRRIRIGNGWKHIIIRNTKIKTFI